MKAGKIATKTAVQLGALAQEFGDAPAETLIALIPLLPPAVAEAATTLLKLAAEHGGTVAAIEAARAGGTLATVAATEAKAAGATPAKLYGGVIRPQLQTAAAGASSLAKAIAAAPHALETTVHHAAAGAFAHVLPHWAIPY